jgi:hypothetical protein
MALTRDDWQKVVLIVVGAVLTGVINITIREWYQPYVQYATGSAYIHPQCAFGRVGLKNWGRSDAENVIITASLPDPIIKISTDQIATPFEPSAGSIGQKFVTGTIKRLVPGEIVNIYFTMDPSSPGVDLKPSIRGPVKFNGGMGSTGLPVLFFWGPQLLMLIVFTSVTAVGVYYLPRWGLNTYDNSFREAVQMGSSAAQQGISKEALDTRIEAWRKTLPILNRPRKETLITCAQAAFEGAKQNPT